jgi:peptidoglycan/LPS O-acetylase OafA/YrhL
LGFFPGVPIFFIISGFLIYASLDRNKSNIKQYIKNRILRIYPALWVCIAISASLLLLADNNNEIFSSGYFYLWLIGQGSFFQFYTPDILRFWGVGTPNGSLWTISVEMQFYFIVPFLAQLIQLGTNKKIVIIGLLLLAIALNIIIGGVRHSEWIPIKLLVVSIIPYFYYFLIGILAFIYFRKVEPMIKGHFLKWVIVYMSFSYVFALYLGFDTHAYWITSIVNIIADALLTLCVLAAAYTRNNLSNILKGNDISYGVYIYHMLIVNLYVEFGWTGNPSQLITCLMVVIILAWLSWKFVEKRALLYKYPNKN